MKPYYQDDLVTIYHGDCQEVVPHLDPIDACVTDPPYGLAFMGKAWDYDVPTVDLWRLVHDALKPGGHLLAFAGTRTQHRMALNIEDAGFDIRDMIAWVYGTGFPKSLDVSKAIDKAAGAEREVVGIKVYGDGHVQNNTQRRNQSGRYNFTMRDGVDPNPTETAPATEAAKQWEGFGTALKPALEPITLARKPLEGTVAENVLTHGTGALDIDGCRVSVGQDQGRWPANLIHDGSPEVVERFPESDGGYFPPGGKRSSAGDSVYGSFSGNDSQERYMGDSGSAARFYYVPKACKADRGPSNNHPTVKPVDLMAYLVRLVTPPGAVVLDPFAGSGTTLVAARKQGRRAIGIEREEEYCRIAVRRLAQGVLPL